MPPAPIPVTLVTGKVGDGKSFWIESQTQAFSKVLRIGVNEVFNADSCSQALVDVMKKLQADGKNAFSIGLHLDIAGGTSITEPLHFHSAISEDQETASFEGCF